MRLLIVDDEEPERLGLRRFLSKRNYTVFEAPDGAKALEVLDSEEVDVVISDIRMPNLDGIGLLKAVKDRKLELEVILITAYMDLESSIEATRNRAYDYIRKPYNLAEILQVLKRIESERDYRKILVEKQKQIERNRWLSALGAVSTGIMHEFNNPNAVIMGHAGHLVEALKSVFERDPKIAKAIAKAGITGEEILFSLEAINNASLRIAEITRRATLFKLSDMEKRNSFDVRAALAQSLSRLDPSQRLAVTESVPAHPVTAFGHSEMLTLALNAILENACDAVKGVEHGRVHVTISSGDNVYIDIDNNGPPISAEMREKIFDPFVTSKGDRPGRGLGLFIAERIVADQSGSIRHHRLADGATRFTITLPHERNDE